MPGRSAGHAGTGPGWGLHPRPAAGARPEQPIQRGGVVLHPAALAVQGEAHRRRLGGHAQFVEQCRQQRVVQRIEDDEAGVHRHLQAIDLYVVGMGVAAQIVVGLVQRHVMVAAQFPGADQTRDAGTDDSDAHGHSLARASTQAGTGFKSQIRPAAASRRRPYQVMSISRARKPWRAEPG
ncbi:hypothetical protein G6F68_011933 [Rhizopus microsporus]|nr:hypothetical protein G6F68_011933 [Rhizopus microsporus]